MLSVIRDDEANEPSYRSLLQRICAIEDDNDRLRNQNQILLDRLENLDHELSRIKRGVLSASLALSSVDPLIFEASAVAANRRNR